MTDEQTQEQHPTLYQLTQLMKAELLIEERGEHALEDEALEAIADNEIANEEYQMFAPGVGALSQQVVTTDDSYEQVLWPGRNSKREKAEKQLMEDHRDNFNAIAAAYQAQKTILDVYSDMQAILMEHEPREEEAPQRRGLMSRLRSKASSEDKNQDNMPVARPTFNQEYSNLQNQLLGYISTLSEVRRMLNASVNTRDFNYYIDRNARRTTAGYKMNDRQRELWNLRADIMGRIDNQLDALTTYKTRVGLLNYQKQVSNTD